MRWNLPGPRATSSSRSPSPSPADPGERGADPGDTPVRWLTYRCARCGGRFYSGYTSTSLERILAQPGGEPDLFHADCAVETPWREAALEYDDGAPWSPPEPSADGAP